MNTLDQKLRSVIDHLANSARTSKLISINAALLADQLHQGRTQNAAALKIVASEIRRLNDESASGIASLYAILEEVRLLTHTINLAGRQRMLSQKIMKVVLLQQMGQTPASSNERRHLIDDFQRGLAALKACRLNTREIDAQLEHTSQRWQEFVAALGTGDIARAAVVNEQVLQEMHVAVQRYEQLAGTESVLAIATVSPVPPAIASPPLRPSVPLSYAEPAISH